MIDIQAQSNIVEQEKDPNIIQRRAANPLTPVWVGASAGTGKTKVLTDRVLRLLLPDHQGRQGTAAHRILCLTYTKAAAAEMKERITETLRQWAVMKDDELRTTLDKKLFGEPATALQFERARSLFAAVVDVPGGLKIMTIHAFCSSILARFPLEAGLYPGMEAMEEPEAHQLLKQAFTQVIELYNSDPKSTLQREMLNRLLREKNDDQILDLIKDMLRERRQFENIVKHKHGLLQLIEDVYTALDADILIDEQVLSDRFFEDIYARQLELYDLIKAFTDQDGKTHNEAGWNLKNFIESGNRSFKDWCSIFLTKEGTVTKNVASIVKKADHITGVFDPLMDKTLHCLKQIKANRLAQQTTDLLFVGNAVKQAYRQLKEQQAKLDYDDLIIYTANLLDSAVHMSRVQWVMYKLDGGIDHILLDEAQDTNPDQWEIIKHLCTEFFTGIDEEKDRPRTLFVVGDEKQSIYSFQRANPAEFRKMKKHFTDKFEAVSLPLQDVPMNISFRTAQTVLDHVDDVLEDNYEPHISFREGQAGHIEIWPLLKDGVKAKEDNWPIPNVLKPAENAAPVLAKKIATTIREWLDTKRMLDARNRPIEPRDIMILVRSRNALVRQIIRALKAQNIPLSGADRMVLMDEIVVMDLLAVMSFALQPEDDLTLATILKSPFIALSEEALLELSYGREKTSLWQALKKHEQYKKITQWLEVLLTLSGEALPFEFLNHLLISSCPASSKSGRHAIAKRLGEDVFEAVDELMAQALSFEQNNIAGLQYFVQHMRAQNIEIKRETDTGENVVRIMTVHGAKGLQAPIVFLPDSIVTSHSYSKLERLLWPHKTGIDVPLWSASKENDIPLYKELRDNIKTQQMEEYQRLLYVAMTRAEDELYICGKRGKFDPLPESWYLVTKRALEKAEDVSAVPFTVDDPNYLEDETKLVLHRDRLSDPDRVEKQDALEHIEAQALPDWVDKMMPEEPNPPSPLTPSRPSDVEPAVLSPLSSEQSSRFKRGNITHALLQFLPDLPVEKRRQAAKNWLSKPAHDLSAEVQQSIADETLAILEDPNFAPLFGKGSMAEVPLSGLLGKQILSGQIDRLLITDTEVWIIDYKSNRPSPQRIEDVPAIYMKQMRSYRQALEKIYPHHHIKTYLLWTDGPRLMEIV
ncbi:MAG: double-strand break repair helicase AddA [Micavibrio sp.]|nr:double-strand break repair helicase AddA [Micavibrio sp.]